MLSRHDATQGRREGGAAGAVPPGNGRECDRGRLLADVFELFPYGIAVVSPQGSIVAWNRALAEIAGGDGADGLSCCELLGCRWPGGPLEGMCLSAAAVAARDRLPEQRIELPGSGRAVWVTAARLDAEASRVVLHVRPADDAASRAPAGSPRLRVFTLGRMRVETSQGPVGGEWLDQRAGQLLKLLVCERRRVLATDEIAEALWPNPRTATANTVRHFVHALRERLEPERPRHAPSRSVIARRGGYVLDRDNVWIDADEFEATVNRGLATLAKGSADAAADDLERALALYRGDFLADDPYAEWAFSERERLRALVDEPLRALSELHADDLDAAGGYLERLAQLEPFDHEVQRQLLTLWMRQGRLSRAVRHYRVFEQRMVREFGAPPDFRLSELVVPAARGALPVCERRSRTSVVWTLG